MAVFTIAQHTCMLLCFLKDGLVWKCISTYFMSEYYDCSQKNFIAVRTRVLEKYEKKLDAQDQGPVLLKFA